MEKKETMFKQFSLLGVLERKKEKKMGGILGLKNLLQVFLGNLKEREGNGDKIF